MREACKPVPLNIEDLKVTTFGLNFFLNYQMLAHNLLRVPFALKRTFPELKEPDPEYQMHTLPDDSESEDCYRLPDISLKRALCGPQERELPVASRSKNSMRSRWKLERGYIAIKGRKGTVRPECRTSGNDSTDVLSSQELPIYESGSGARPRRTSAQTARGPIGEREEHHERFMGADPGHVPSWRFRPC